MMTNFQTRFSRNGRNVTCSTLELGATLVFRSLHGTLPAYLADMLQRVTEAQRRDGQTQEQTDGRAAAYSTL